MARKRKSNGNERARLMVAQETARIIVNQGIRDFGLAKKKAAERLGLRDRGSLPGNAEIEAAIGEHLELFRRESHADFLQLMRRVALSAMELLSPFTPRLVGPVLAKELIYTGRIIDAAEAERIGLVNNVVPDDEVLSAARELALSIAKQGSLAVRISKLALNAAGRPNPAFETLDAIAQAVCFESEDKHVRMQAFLDRRKNKAKS